MKISKEELLKKIRKDLPTKTEEPEICETLPAPPLKDVVFIKDCCRVGEIKFYNWLFNVRFNGNRGIFQSRNEPYKKTYKILNSKLEGDKRGSLIISLEVIDDENPETKDIGKTMELKPDDIVDLVGEEEFSYNKDHN